jgi:long-chain acyl-CoA synthetase
MPPFETLVGLVATFASRGERPAVIVFRHGGATELNYADLAAAIDRTAHGLRARGITSGDRVALWAPNSSEWIIAYFAIVAAGAAAVPLDHQSTSESAAAALAHADLRMIITTRAHRQELERTVAAVPASSLLDGEGADSFAALGAPHAAAALPPVAGTDLASILFTSGTTGTPKAVPLTHANLTANTRELLAAQLIRASDRVLLPLPLHHTYPFTAGLLTALATGAAVVLPAGISGPEISEACSAGRATALLAVPKLCTAIWDSVTAGVRARGTVATALFRALLATSSGVRRATGLHVGKWLFRAVHTRLGAALGLIGCGGAKLPAELGRNLEALGWTVLTGYGLTETSPVLTFNSPQHARLGSEGRALPGVELRIADAASATPGEILARGPSVFSGYWKNAAATAAAFTADGWFRTGDLGRVDSRGYLYVVGRSKELIVLADGKKIFPEAIEKLYAGCSLLSEIGVFERGGALAAVVVPDEDAVRARGALREAAWLREEIEDVASRLPPYQRITSYRVVRTPLPRTQLGKLKRHLLPALFDGVAPAEASPAPAALEAADRELVESPRGGAVWRWLHERYPNHALTLDTSPQFDLAIDSLEWVTLTTEIEQRFGVVLRSEQLSGILTLRDLLRAIETAGDTPAEPAPPSPPYTPPGRALTLLGATVFAVLRVAIRVALRLKVTGTERLPDGPALITPNHTSYLDALVVAAALPWHRLRRTYWAGWVGVMHTSPLRRLLSRATQVFPMDPARDLATGLRTAQELLAAGYSVVWFPEGRRSPTGKLTAFQDGVGLLLDDAAVAAVPTAIRGTFAAWPKHRKWPRVAPVSVAFGTALRFDAGSSAAEIRAALERAVADLLGQPLPRARHSSPLSDRRGDPVMSETSTGPTTATLRDGRRVTIRPIRRDDVARNAAFLDALSPPSKHFLFLGGISHLSDAALSRLCDPDYAHEMAYVALAADTAAAGGERQVGVCRYAGEGAEGAEISVAVADDWQHQGLGKLLLRQLIAYAGSHGVRRLYSMDAASNEAMRRLAREVGFREEPDPDDIHQVIYSLEPRRA